MSTHKHIDKICVVAIVLSLIITILFMNSTALGIQAISRTMGYEDRLFDTSRVHTIDIVMNDWDSFIETCENEEYAVAAVVIDGESYKNVGIRAKGNTSLSMVSAMNSDRYSFKIEFDQYDNSKSYYGLDKLSLNNVIQDTTYMKDYLTYQLMGTFGVDAPLCSYVYITVNGEDWGLYLAVEGVEDGFLQRNYGSDYGNLYKPDSMGFGGGRGNGRDFNMEDFMNSRNEESDAEGSGNAGGFGRFGGMQGFGAMSPPGMQGDQSQGDFDPSTMFGGQIPQDFDTENLPNRGMVGGMGSGDVKLQYIDDDPSSYSNIFDNAKTDITKADKSRLIESLKKLSSGEDIESVVNIDEVIRFFVVHNFVVNGDSYTGSMVHNYYLYEKDGQLSMIPWDYNLAFGTFSFMGGGASSVVNDPIDTPLSVTGSGDRPMIDWILSNDEYLELYHQHFSEFIESTDVISLIDETKALIAPYVEKDPTAFYSYEEFETGVDTLREFCSLRVESIQGQLDGTIPTMTDGQSSDSSSLIDASQLTLSDMGSMGGMGGGFGNRANGQFGGFPNMRNGQSSGITDMPPSQSDEEANEGNSLALNGSQLIPPGMGNSDEAGGRFGQFAESGELPEMPEGMQRPEGMQMPGNIGEASDDVSSRLPFGNRFGMAEESSQSGASSIVLFSVSVVVLLLGLAVAFKFKR